MIHDPECFVECKGRDVEGREVLKESLRVKVNIHLSENRRIIRFLGGRFCF